MAQSIPTGTFGVAKWVVSADATQGTHTTIGAALTSASSGDTIFIRPGTYTENITGKAGVNLAALDTDGYSNVQTTVPTANVIILGTVTVSASGNFTATGIQFKTNSAAAIATTGSNTAIMTCINCSVFANNSTAITLNNSTSNLEFISCAFFSASTNNLFAETTSSGMAFTNCIFNLPSTSTASTSAVGTMDFQSCELHGFFITTSGTGNVRATGCNWVFSNTTLITMAGTGNSTITNCSLSSGTSSAISIGSGCICNISDCLIISTNTNAITGSGTLNYGMLSFSASTTINVTTQTGYQTLVGTTGTFTPTLVGASVAGTTTYSVQNGYYTRIGNLVFVTADVTISAATGTGNVALGGLPFTIKSQTNGYVNGTVFWNGSASWTWPAGTTSVSALGTTNTTVLNVWAGGTAVGGGFVQMANAALQVSYSIVYQI